MAKAAPPEKSGRNFSPLLISGSLSLLRVIFSQVGSLHLHLVAGSFVVAEALIYVTLYLTSFPLSFVSCLSKIVTLLFLAFPSTYFDNLVLVFSFSYFSRQHSEIQHVTWELRNAK